MDLRASRTAVLKRFVSQEWKSSTRELWADLRAVRWTRTLLWFGSCDIDGFCMPDGSFNVKPSDYNIWKTSGFFQITLGFGHLSFALAKFIDIAFDIVAGRGGQTILAIISYQTIKRYITAAMETSPISYGTYKAVFLRDDIPFSSLVALIRECLTYRPLSSTLAMTWIVLSTIFVIIFPTLVSAMSGYSANGHAYIRDASGNFMDYENLFLIDYVIHDASRLNFTYFGTMEGQNSTYWGNFTLKDPYFVKRPKKVLTCLSVETYFDMPYVKARVPDDFSVLIEGYRSFDCVLRQLISDYTTQHGFFGLKQNNSTFLGATIPAPIINVTAHYIDPEIDWDSGRDHSVIVGIYGLSNHSNGTIYGNNWTNPTTGNRHFYDQDQATYTTSSNNETFVLGDSTTSGKCQPEVSYQWGFSFLLLFIFLITLLIWTLGTYIMWLKARLAMRHHDDMEIVGEYKAAIILASAMNNDFDKHGKNPSVLRERQIKSVIKKELKGGTMMYQSPLREQRLKFRERFRRWLIKDKWWILAFTISLVCLLVPIHFGTWEAFIFQIFSSYIVAGIIAARTIGRTYRSRALLLIIFMVFDLITTISLGIM
ncbi:hypothetical protein FKW77_005407 [Venturia effusa]|uniref:Uncharacterized protein n=1 Tax=Venturia effusa TaxID=50376 RepID=A0A517LNZ6_9PEZI|nr:hypothetical protein FKW77_005407 [Venturia effusa]